MAMAVMVLGANGCGDDDGEGGIDTSERRLEKIAGTACKLILSCTEGPFVPESGDSSIGSQQECVDQWVQETKQILAKVDDKCFDAYLDYYECYVSESCDGAHDKCKRSAQSYMDACDDMT